MTTKYKPNSLIKGCTGIVFVLILGVIALSSLVPDEPEVDLSAYNQLVYDRYEDLKEDGFVELVSVDCVNSNCMEGVNFILSSNPEDLDMVIRGNTATLSNFQYEHTSDSDVTVHAYHNGKLLMSCDGSGGMVDSCQ